MGLCSGDGFLLRGGGRLAALTDNPFPPALLLLLIVLSTTLSAEYCHYSLGGPTLLSPVNQCYHSSF